MFGLLKIFNKKHSVPYHPPSHNDPTPISAEVWLKDFHELLQ